MSLLRSARNLGVALLATSAFCSLVHAGTEDSGVVVSTKTNRAEKFALTQSLKATEFTLGTIYPRIFSPNGDGWNDVCTFTFENPKDASAEGKIYDIAGSFVANMTLGGLPDSLRWDGKDSSGRTVSAGIYFYQIKAERKSLTGTVVVAK